VRHQAEGHEQNLCSSFHNQGEEKGIGAIDRPQAHDQMGGRLEIAPLAEGARWQPYGFNWSTVRIMDKQYISDTDGQRTYIFTPAQLSKIEAVLAEDLLDVGVHSVTLIDMAGTSFPPWTTEKTNMTFTPWLRWRLEISEP